jgi:hypothetical protein
MYPGDREECGKKLVRSDKNVVKLCSNHDRRDPGFRDVARTPAFTQYPSRQAVPGKIIELEGCVEGECAQA